MMCVSKFIAIFVLFCPFAVASDLPHLLKNKERHASLIFRGIKNDKMIFDNVLDSESTDRTITEVFYIPVSNVRYPILQALSYGDIVPVLVAPEDCFQTNEVPCASPEDAAALLVAPVANTICGNVRVRGQATLLFDSDLTLYAFSSYTSTSYLVSEVVRALETSPGEDCLYTVDFWWGTVTCDSPGGPCTKIKTRQKHIMEEKCSSSSGGASVCASGGVGKAPKFCGTVEYKTATWSRSSSEKEEHAFGGNCKKVGNACVCELSAAGQTAFQTWFNEPLPAPACAGGAGACPNQKCPSSAPSIVPAPSPAPYPAPAPSLSPAPYPVPGPASSPSPAHYPVPVPSPEPVPSVTPMVTPTPQETNPPTPVPAPTEETSPPVPTGETAPPTPVPAPTSETSPPVPTHDTTPPTPVPAPTSDTSPPVPTGETAPSTPVSVPESSSPVTVPTIGTPPPSPIT
jgi:hypothetical protein